MTLCRSTLVVCFFALAVCLALAGCSSSLARVADTIGLTDPALPRAFTLSLVCDSSSASCTPERLKVVLIWALDVIADRPGSKLRLFALGDDLSSTQFLTEVSSTAPASPAVAVVKAHHERFRSTALNQLLSAARPIWSVQHRASPIAEGLGAIARFPVTGKHVVLLQSDLREMSAYGQFECANLPTTAAWTSRTKSLFSPLRGSTVIVAFASPLEPVSGSRCGLSNERYGQIATLWTSALTARGASVKIFADAIPEPLESFLGGAQ